jgi:anti-sigma regulatory factor (Ser/Thr protein kinase)
MEDSDESRTVSLAVPPDPDFLVFARLALGAMCRLTPLRHDEIVDLKLAITEAAAGVLHDGDEPPPFPERLGFTFRLEPDRLVLEVNGSLPPEIPLEERRLGRAILEATVDACEAIGDGVRLEKRLGDGDELG